MSSFTNDLSWQTSITNELRSRAERCGLAMPQTATLMMDAANTIERLKDENIKLRGARDTWQENDAKLRELVREMYEFMSIAEKLNAHIKLSPNETYSFANRMRELGMEFE